MSNKSGGKSWEKYLVSAMVIILIFTGGTLFAAGGISENPRGDFNHDNIVDINDITIFVSYWLEEECNTPNQFCGGVDLDESNDVNFADYSLMAKNWMITGNSSPVVDAGADQNAVYPVNSVNLDGTVTDDGLPNPPGVFTIHWTQESGPQGVVFGDANIIDTTAAFPAGGTYVLRLTANDGELSTYDELTVNYTALPAWSETADYYVDGRTGSDSGSGSSTEPFKTIGKAASVVTAGKKILVWGNQTYTEQVSFSNSGASDSNQITCKRDPNSGEAIIRGNGSSNYPIYSNGKSYIVVDGFTITNGLYGVYINGDNADHVTIQNCRVRGNVQHGICINAGDNCTLFNNAVYLNGTAHNGIYIYSGASGQTINQCTIYNQKYGIQVTQSSSSATVRDCIITNNTTYGLYKNMGMGSITSTYCDVWGNGANYSGCSAGANSISSNPMFADPNNGDFHLEQNSPCCKKALDGGDMGYRYSNSAR